MDYSEIKDYIDYDRYINTNDDLDKEKRYMRMIDDLEYIVSKIEEKWDECENPKGCECREPQRMGDAHEGATSLISYLKRSVKTNVRDMVKWNADALPEGIVENWNKL